MAPNIKQASHWRLVFCSALIRLLRETCPEAGLPKFTDLLMKCIWRNVKTLPERSNELNYDAVMLEVHEFMLALPSSWWQTRPSDTPLRTVKTIIHNMAKVKGNAILQHLNQIPTHSELHAYLIKILKVSILNHCHCFCAQTFVLCFVLCHYRICRRKETYQARRHNVLSLPKIC